MNVPPGYYTITTGRRLTAEQAADGVIPDDATWTLIDTEHHGRLVTYLYLIGYTEAA